MPNYRIATLLPSATELVAEIGLAKSIVCISHECDTPTHITHLPKVTSSNITNYDDQTLIDQFVKESVKEEKSLFDDSEEEQTVDIDTSGPEVEVQLPEEKKEDIVVEQTTEDKTYENERETKLEDGGIADDTSEKSDEQSDVQKNQEQETKKQETKK